VKKPRFPFDDTGLNSCSEVMRS